MSPQNSFATIEADETTVVNAKIRRIDLVCKLVGPLAIALVAAASVRIAIWTVLGLNLASVLIEYICIERVSAGRLEVRQTRLTAFRSTEAYLRSTVPATRRGRRRRKNRQIQLQRRPGSPSTASSPSAPCIFTSGTPHSCRLLLWPCSISPCFPSPAR